MTRFDAAVFDLDGLLIDTERVAITTGYAALNALGHSHDAGLLERLVGHDNATGLRLLRAELGQGFDAQAFDLCWRDLFHAETAKGIPLRPGARDLLDLLEQAAIPRAVATSSSRESATRKLQSTGLAPYFQTVVSVDCIQNPKPAPDPYLEAARRLGFHPARCVAFEDSDTGAAAAHAAGMTVVQIPDMVATSGPFAHHLSDHLLDGARIAGLI